jgi:hypothetical protein
MDLSRRSLDAARVVAWRSRFIRARSVRTIARRRGIVHPSKKYLEEPIDCAAECVGVAGQETLGAFIGLTDRPEVGLGCPFGEVPGGLAFESCAYLVDFERLLTVQC